MSTYVTSDLHFYHENILKFESLKKFRGDLYSNVEEMNEAIIKAWNSKVGPQDTVIDVGDFCMGNGNRLKERLRLILPRLNGKIVHVRGNHGDSHGDEVWLEYGHKVVDMYKYKTPKKQLVVFCHYPLVSWERSHYGSIMVHGHVHGKYQGPGRILDAGWDVYGELMNINDLVDIANARPVVSVDGH